MQDGLYAKFHTSKGEILAELEFEKKHRERWGISLVWLKEK